MKIAIVGYGLQGQSVYEYYKGSDNQITICDQNPALELATDVKSQLGTTYLSHLDRFDLIFRGPSVRPDDLVEANGAGILAKVTTNTNEFFKLCPTKNIIGVTGTKGKGTTTTLITKMLEQCGHRVHLGGNNIGTPPLDLLGEAITAEDWVVLELANFQIIDLKYSPKIAVCLMVEPEHLDWHVDVDEYYRAKTEVFRHQQKTDIAIYYAKNENSKRIASTSPGTLLPYFAPPGALVAGSHITIDGIPVVRINELKLLGKHNWQNVCAALTATWQVTQDPEAIAEVLRDFSGLPFRIEVIRELNDVKYVNDSFASHPTGTIAAIEAVKEPKILILGGMDRNLDLKDLSKTLVDHNEDIRRVLVIGESAGRLTGELKQLGFTNFEILSSPVSMTDIVKRCSELVQKGDNVILSPGFPSFDMFKNFEDRGLQFNAAVEAL